MKLYFVKTNRKATVGSLVGYAVMGAVGGAAFWMMQQYLRSSVLPGWTVLIAVVVGAFVGWLIEWQMPC